MSHSTYELPKLLNDFQIKAFKNSLSENADVVRLQLFMDRLLLTPPEEESVITIYNFLNIILEKYPINDLIKPIIIDLNDLFFRRIFYIESFCEDISLSEFYLKNPESIDLLIDILEYSYKGLSFKDKIDSIKRISHNKSQRRRLNNIYEEFNRMLNV